MEQHKNFTILLKAAIDKRLKETGIWDKVLKASKHNDEYSGLWHKAIDSLSDITLDYLNGVKSPVVEQPKNLPIEELVKLSDEELSTKIDKIRTRLGMGKREHPNYMAINQEANINEFIHNAAALVYYGHIYAVKGVRSAEFPNHETAISSVQTWIWANCEADWMGVYRLKPQQPIPGPWSFGHHHVQNREDADEYTTITDGKITLYLDQQEDEEGEQKLCNLLNQLKAKVDWDRESEFMMYEYKRMYEEVEAVANPSFLTALQNEPVQAIHSLVMKHTNAEQREALLGKIERRAAPVAGIRRVKGAPRQTGFYHAQVASKLDAQDIRKVILYYKAGSGYHPVYGYELHFSVTTDEIIAYLDESAQPLRDNTEEESAVMGKLIDKHIGGMCHLEKASIKYFLESGTINGSFRLRLISLMTFYKWHIESMQPLREKADEGGKEIYRDVKVDGFPELNTVVEVWIEENEMPFHAGWRDDGLGPCWHSSAYEVQENKDHIRYWRPLRLDRPIQSLHNK